MAEAGPSIDQDMEEAGPSGFNSSTSERYDLEFHRIKLRSFCRICGMPRILTQEKYRPLIRVVDHAKHIEWIHGVNVNDDDVQRHPLHMCYSCKSKLGKLVKMRHQKKKSNSTTGVFQFNPHDQNCSICNYAPRRTPRKTPSKSPYASKSRKSSTFKGKELFPKDSTTTDTANIEEMKLEDDVITSVPIHRTIEKELADNLACGVCAGIPTQPIVTRCGHIQCKSCVCLWLKNSHSCPTCKSILDASESYSLSGFTIDVFGCLHVTCVYQDQGCKCTVSVLDIESHQNNCRYGKYKSAVLKKPLKTGRPEHYYLDDKIPLSRANSQYVKRKRLKVLIEFLTDFCNKHKESKLDVLFFLLVNELQSTKNREVANHLKDLWMNEKTLLTLSPDEALSLRVDMLQSKTQYKKQYDFFKEKGKENIFCPPSQLETTEKTYMPGCTEYEIQKDGQQMFRHAAETDASPTDVLGGINEALPEIPVPNCKGVRWRYADAISKSLEEIDPLIKLKMEEIGINDDCIIRTFIKDGGDGMGEVAIHKERADRYLPNKALRFSFCILESRITYNGSEYILFTEEHPNSVRSNRPVLEAIADENNKASALFCLAPIEQERQYLIGKVIKIKLSDGTHRFHTIDFVSSMEDEKYERAFGGLQSSGSAFLCTLCHATVETAKSNVGEFHMVRTRDETSTLADYLRINPDNLSQNQLSKIAKGVKGAPMLLTEPQSRLIDATHADINMGTFFKKLIVRCIAGIDQWEATSDVKGSILDAEARFDFHIKKTVGSNPQLMMPGNYARMLFEEKNEMHMLQLVPEREKVALKSALQHFRFLRSVYRAVKPEEEAVSQYKVTAVSFAKSLILNFPFIRVTNYLHKIVEHVQELIEDPQGPGTIGACNGEGLEAGNKLFRHFRKNLAAKGNTQQGLIDVLKYHWLYSSHQLQNLSKVSHRKNKCGVCGKEGHNRLTCAHDM